MSTKGGTQNEALSADQRLVLQLVNGVAERQGVRVFLVGGVVRDLLRGFSIQDKDIDLIVEGDAGSFAQSCLPLLGGTVKHFERFFTAKIIAPTEVPRVAEIDFASTRAEVYASDGALPKVSPVPDIVADLGRRDFTVNAIALPIDAVLTDSRVDSLAQQAVDPFSGRSDLRHGVVRVLHANSFIDDPTRIFRAARYVTRLSGTLDSETQGWLDAAVKKGVFGTVSVFRLAMEIKKVASERRWLSVARLLDSWNVWAKLWNSDAQRLSQALIRWTGWHAAWSAQAPSENYFERISPAAVQQALLALLAPCDPESLEAWGKRLQYSRAERLRLMQVIQRMAYASEPGGRESQSPGGPQTHGAVDALFMLAALDPKVDGHHARALGCIPQLLSTEG